VRLVVRTLDLLERLAEQPDGIGVQRLAQQLGEPPSSVHRLLTALADRGYVLKDGGTRRYRLGHAVLRLSRAHQQRNQLVAIATPHMAALSARTLESVFLAELVGDDVVCVASSESPRPLSFYMRVGQRTPYHAASSARAILAFRPKDQQVAMMTRERLERFTSLTPDTVDLALRHLEVTRERGYAVCDQEMEEGITAMSAPVRAGDGEVIASVTLVAPQDRLMEPSREATALLVIEAADAISRELGYRPGLGEAGAVA
jgi:DNA-binding IclR family transcriptional regulator